MKLIYFGITSEFRNLKGIKLDFKEMNETCVIIGNNGTGKTNILEALSCVFAELMNGTLRFPFEFKLIYEINGVNYRVVNKNPAGLCLERNKEVVGWGDMIFPSRIVCNYSGEDPRMRECYYDTSFKDYIDSVRKGQDIHPLRMVYIDRSMWAFILLCMLACREDVDAFDHFLTDKLGINAQGVDEIKLLLDLDKLSKWKEQNSITYYLQSIRQRMGDVSPLVSNDAKNFNPSDTDSRSLFYNLVGAGQVIKELRISFNGGVEETMLSEGEKKMMVVLFILEAIADEQTLVLMDEPDSHIHISRKAELCEMFQKMHNRSNVITSHSPTLTAAFSEKQRNSIVMLRKTDDGHVENIDKEIRNLVEELTCGTWTAQKQNLFLNSHEDIMIVEGPTDELFISQALQYFKKQGKYLDLNFEFIPSGGASRIKSFAEKFRPYTGQMIFAFYDADSAGLKNMNEVWKQSDKDKDMKIADFGKARKKGNAWFSFYPAYKGRHDKTNFNVEDYFTCELFRKYILSFSSLDTIKTKEGLKGRLAEDCEKGKINGKYYKKFATLFDHILLIKQKEAEGVTEF